MTDCEKKALELMRRRRADFEHAVIHRLVGAAPEVLAQYHTEMWNAAVEAAIDILMSDMRQQAREQLNVLGWPAAK